MTSQNIISYLGMQSVVFLFCLSVCMIQSVVVCFWPLFGLFLASFVAVFGLFLASFAVLKLGCVAPRVTSKLIGSDGMGRNQKNGFLLPNTGENQ